MWLWKKNILNGTLNFNLRVQIGGETRKDRKMTQEMWLSEKHFNRFIQKREEMENNPEKAFGIQAREWGKWMLQG